MIVAHKTGTLLAVNHYYPFGLRWNGQGSPFHKYQFGGKEYEEELNLNTYDFHARQMDPVLGRFWGVDPMSSERVSFSPFNYVQNNPMNRVDPSGMLDDWYENENGDFVFNKSIKGKEEFDKSGIAGEYFGSQGSFINKEGFIEKLFADGTRSDRVFLKEVEVGDIGESNFFKDHFEISGGFEISTGGQIGGGFKNGFGGMIDLGSSVQYDLSLSSKNSNTGGEYKYKEKINEGIGAAYYGGFNYKQQTYNGLTTNNLSVGVVGFGGNVSWNQNGINDWFFGFDPSFKAAFIVGIEANFRIGFSK